MFVEEQENLVEETENTEQQTAEENVEESEEVVEEETTEESDEVEKPEEKPEMFTKEQVDEMLAKKLARKTNKIRRDYEKKYSKLETVLNAGLGTSNLDEATNKLSEFYEEKGIQIPDKPSYSERDTELLANAEAQEIIDSGYEDIKEEVDRLAEIGVENMSSRDKIIFSKLANERQRIEEERDLASIGVDKSFVNEKEFKDFCEKLNPKLSLREKYEMYISTKPKKETKQIGSMKSGAKSKVKEFYSAEEISKLTEEDLDNDETWEAVRRSMTGQA